MEASTPLDFVLRLFADPKADLQVQVLEFFVSGERPNNIIAQQSVVFKPNISSLKKDAETIKAAICCEGSEEKERQAMYRLGDHLRQMLFPPNIWNLFLERLRYCRGQLRLRLLIEPAEYASLPYEYLYVRGSHGGIFDNEFIALYPNISLIRSSGLQNEALSLAPADVLRILVVYCNPEKDEVWPRLDSLEAERNAIIRALNPLEKQNPALIKIEQIDNPSPEVLLSQIRRGYHALVYMGHGYDNNDGYANQNLGPDCPIGTYGLVLNDGWGGHSYLTGERFAKALAETTVRLCIMNACVTMRTALYLAERGLTAIGMHFEQPDTAGMLFGEAFWRFVAGHEPVDICLKNARETLVFTLTRDRPEWGNAALIMNSHDGVLLGRPENIERANYLRFLDRRFPRDQDACPSNVDVCPPGEPEVTAEMTILDALVQHTKLIVEGTNLAELTAELMDSARAIKVERTITEGALKADTLPIWIPLDRWVACTNIEDFLSSSIRDMGLSASFVKVLLQHIRDGQAVLIFESMTAKPLSREAMGWILDLASGLARESRLLVVVKPGQNLSDWRNAGFAVASRQDRQKAEAPLQIRVWVETVTFNQTRDIIVTMPSKTRARYNIGDSVVIHFWANADCHLTLINYGSSGNIHTLFPNAVHADPFIPGNAVCQIPDPIHKFAFRLAGPPGLERIRAIATRNPMREPYTSGAQQGSLFARRTTRDIELLVKEVQAEGSPDRADAECEIIVV